jgi:hypothetical protein
MNKDLDLGAIERHYENLTADYRIERVQAVANYVLPLIAEIQKLRAALQPVIHGGYEFCPVCGTVLGMEGD